MDIMRRGQRYATQATKCKAKTRMNEWAAKNPFQILRGLFPAKQAKQDNKKRPSHIWPPPPFSISLPQVTSYKPNPPRRKPSLPALPLGRGALSVAQ